MDAYKTYQLGGSDAEIRMDDVMKMFRYGFRTIGGFAAERILEHGEAVEYDLSGGHSVTLKPLHEDSAIEVSVSAAGDALAHRRDRELQL